MSYSIKSLMTNRFFMAYGRLVLVAIIAVLIGSVYLVRYILIPRSSTIITQSKTIAFKTTKNDDCDIPKGTSHVVTNGANGVEVIKYKVIYVNHQEVSRTVVSDQTTVQPTTEVINAGIDDPRPPGSSDASYPCANSDKIYCDLENLTPGLASAGGSMTRQAYDSYVQQMDLHKCGTPKPYCMFNMSSPCGTSGSSTTTLNSGFEAGYNYAAEYHICDTVYSNGNSQDFNDGVQAWASENCTNGQPN